MFALKQSKIVAKIVRGTLITAPSRESCFFTVEITDSRGVTNDEIYAVYCETPTEGYTVRKMGETGVKETYQVNMWDMDCGCAGRKNGYLCRHLRMVSALTKTKRIK